MYRALGDVVNPLSPPRQSSALRREGVEGGALNPSREAERTSAQSEDFQGKQWMWQRICRSRCDGKRRHTEASTLISNFNTPLMAPCRTLVVPWCVRRFLRLRIGLGVRRTWRKLEKTCSTFKLQCRKGDTIQDLRELEFFISCAFLGVSGGSCGCVLGSECAEPGES